MANVTSETAGHGDGHGHGHGEYGPWLAHHFDTPEQQFDSAKLGMWIFICTEILMFGGLFVGYGILRAHEPDMFRLAHERLDRIMGAANTIVLLFSSLTAALAVRSSQLGKKQQTSVYLVITVLCACVFLVVKYFEYSQKFEHGLLPGHYFRGDLPAYAHNGAVLPTRSHVFYSIYFMMTGLHGVHVVVGMSILVWVLVRNNRGDFSPEYFTPVEIGALYWHLVDLVWIYLFPLLYLVG